VNKFVAKIASDYNKPNGQNSKSRGCNWFLGRITHS
jgi:nucleotidyltransferase/DNA polymerase involved in DNA repair